MRRKAVSLSTVVARKPVHAPGCMPRPARTGHVRRATSAARDPVAQSADRGRCDGQVGRAAADNTNAEVTDDFPEFAAVLDRELNTIETYLGACLDEMLADMD